MSVETVIYVYMRGNTYLSHAKGRKRIQKKKGERRSYLCIELRIIWTEGKTIFKLKRLNGVINPADIPITN